MYKLYNNYNNEQSSASAEISTASNYSELREHNNAYSWPEGQLLQEATIFWGQVA